MNLSIEQLRVISAVAQSSSFSEAARSLRLTQPAVSRTVQTVEAHVGAQLFARTTRMVELTADGIEFLSVAAAILDEFDAGMGRFAAFQRADRGLLTVAALPVLASGMLAQVVSAFLATRPEVQLNLVTGSAKEVLERLHSGDADVAITELPTEAAGLLVTPLGSDPACAVVPRDHPLGQMGEVRWQDLIHHNFIALSKGTSVRRLTDEGFKAAAVYPNTTVTVDATVTAIAMMSHGMGITVFPLSTQSLTTAGELRFVPLEEPAVSRELAVIAPASPAPSALARQFSATVVSFRTTLAGGPPQPF
ncbi:LysR family transcriptional regulator [Diaminobutyricibacter tongyongensis]|uniref:LysR family transcriptional regulator n=1 Tax=Leifsonia tongyongensis TaxID=1268043 RepID=A0A6L9Y275_9MICO|nr:LysR family transcriptional regulator [Diaminobutyricibacter tongyongensis]NEN07666.1 LysR family transcriptional regulator [Diaminobutyricibacter tongyongensis]